MIINSKYTGNEIEERYLQRVRNRNNIPDKPEDPPLPPLKGSKGFSLEELTDCFRISGVSYRNGIYQVDLSKTLLPTGTQEEQAKRRIEELKANGFYSPDFPLFNGVINALHQNKDGSFKDGIEKARKKLADLVNGNWLTTLTRVGYNPDGTALITHNYNQADSYQKNIGNFTGKDGDITSTANAEGFLQSLLDTSQSVQEISQVYKWLRDLPSWLWRVNSKPKKTDERVAWLIADSDRSIFYCIRYPLGSGSSAGVRVARAKN